MAPHYTVEIGDTTYDIDIDATLTARYIAASEYKVDRGGPSVGQSVSELASDTTIISE